MSNATARLEPVTERTQTTYATRARYRSGENGFDFAWPEVPTHQFLTERDQALDHLAPTALIPLDVSSALRCDYPATTPTLLCRYFRIRANESLHTQFIAAGEIFYVMQGAGESRCGQDVIAWKAGDVFCFPGGNETTHRAGDTPSLLFGVTDEPLLAISACVRPRIGRPYSRRRIGPPKRLSAASMRSGRGRSRRIPPARRFNLPVSSWRPASTPRRRSIARSIRSRPARINAHIGTMASR